VIWLGESTEVPRGWEIPINGNKLKVGIVIGGTYPKYIDANEDSLTGVVKASGLAIEIFEEAVKRLPYALSYEYVVFNTTENVSSSYDDFVYQVYLKVTQLCMFTFSSQKYTSCTNALPRSDISHHGLMASLQIKQTTSIIQMSC